jgi:hypothetical protein
MPSGRGSGRDWRRRCAGRTDSVVRTQAVNQTGNGLDPLATFSAF